MLNDLIINIFVKVDDDCKKIGSIKNENYLEFCNISCFDNSINNITKKRGSYKFRNDTLSESEIITTLLLHQSVSRFKDFKAFYEGSMNKTILLEYFFKITFLQ